MKWFDRWIYRKVRWAWHRAGNEYPEIRVAEDALDDYAKANANDGNEGKRACFDTLQRHDGGTIADSSTQVNMDNSIRFNVLSCSGGIVLEVRSFDRLIHEHITKTYLIPEGEPIAERIGQYVTMEMMVR